MILIIRHGLAAFLIMLTDTVNGFSIITSFSGALNNGYKKCSCSNSSFSVTVIRHLIH